MAREHKSQEKLCHSGRSVIPQHLDPQTTKKNKNQALPLESSWSRKKTDPDMDSDPSEVISARQKAVQGAGGIQGEAPCPALELKKDLL